MSYNGWSNYETWCVALWLGNDEGSYHTACELAQDYPLGYSIRDWCEDMAPDLGASMFSDLLNAALCKVDWIGVAESFKSETVEA